ncbi:MAG: trehalose-phosphatase [Polyangiaceae bacterium]
MTTPENSALPREELERFKARPQRHILVDYDGTLVPFASRPELAVADRDLRRLLSDLSVRHGNRVHIVTGRTRDSNRVSPRRHTAATPRRTRILVPR